MTDTQEAKDIKTLCHKLRLMEQARVTGCFNPGLLFSTRQAIDRLEAKYGETKLLDPPYPSETWQTACDWLEATFGPIKPERIITRAKEEFEELESAENIEQQTVEAADVVMCLMRFPGLWDALIAKMAINRARTWELRGDGTGYHVKPPLTPSQTAD